MEVTSKEGVVVMEEKIAVISCSNACLDDLDYDKDIIIFRSTLHIGDEDFVDYVDIKAKDFYERLENSKSVFPSSSYLPIGQMVEQYEDLVSKGYTKAIVVTISSHMSGLFNAVQVAGKGIEGLEIIAFDSKTVAYPQAKMAITAQKMVKEGKSIDEIIGELEYIRDHNKIYFAVHTLDYLIKNGRLSNASGFIGKALKIKPLLTISEEGKVETVEKIRTFPKAVDKLLLKFFEETKGLDAEPFVIHANNPETSEYIKMKLREADDKYQNVVDMSLTAVVGAHSGPKTIALGYYIKKS
jgi:DegV family protein with EDD domain